MKGTTLNQNPTRLLTLSPKWRGKRFIHLKKKRRIFESSEKLSIANWSNRDIESYKIYKKNSSKKQALRKST